MRIVVHGDDFAVEGAEEDLRWVRTLLESKYIVKMRAMLGPEPGDANVADILGRTVEWKADEIWYEADPRHVEKMLADMDLEGCNSRAAPGAKVAEQEDDEEELEQADAFKYR